ncbi:hypothetical protein BB561_000364 [Smittium simulii]|uniref:GDP-mannose transporter n=1 Tax=Smittium simulii TaxID=133385 RepID=A0A2T9YZE1_9FUNG|nr:hypothetical protein BB561_000364 [Smittium simulii]
MLAEKYKAAMPILSYCASSIIMTLTNKYILSAFTFHMAFLILAIQSLGSVFLLVSASLVFKDIKFRPLNKRDVKLWLPVSVLQVAMLYTGAKALQYLNVPLFTVFKNLTIIAVAYGEKFVFKSTVTPLMLISFLLMIFSSLVGAFNDITFNFYGYFWMGLNCFASASFVIAMRKSIGSVKFKDFDTVYYNNMLTFGMFLVCSLLIEPWSDFVAFYSKPVNSVELSNYLFSNGISGISAFMISYTSAWCLRTTSSTTYSMVGALNKLPISIFAMLWFPDPVTVGGVFAVMFGFAAGIVYTKAKNDIKRVQPQGVQILPPPVSSNSSNEEKKILTSN